MGKELKTHLYQNTINDVTLSWKMVPLIAEFTLDYICPHLVQDRKQKPLWYFQQKES